MKAKIDAHDRQHRVVERINWGAATSQRIKGEIAKGERVWILGASGTGKSYILSHLKGFDLDWAGYRNKGDDNWRWIIDLDAIPPEFTLVGGCFSEPKYADFIAKWKPTKFYVLTCSPEQALRSWLRKRSAKEADRLLLEAAGVTKEGKDRHLDEARDKGLGHAKKWLIDEVNHPRKKLDEIGVPYVLIDNEHKEDRGSPWDQGTKQQNAWTHELVGLAMLARELGGEARELFIDRIVDPVYNPNSWGHAIHYFRKYKVRVRADLMARYLRENKENPWRKYASKKGWVNK